jgi:hypothetical protein
MSTHKRRNGSTSNDVCLIILTVLVVLSLFFFVLVISHDALGSNDMESNKFLRWTVRLFGVEFVGSFLPSCCNTIVQENIVEEGKRDIVKIESYVADKAGIQYVNPQPTQPQAQEQRQYAVGEIKLQPEEPAVAAIATPTLPFHQLKCPDGDLLTFWKQTTEADRKYVSPYANHGPKVKYVTFEPGKRHATDPSINLRSLPVLLFCL